MRQAFKNLKEAGGFKGKLASLTEDDIMPTDSYERYLPYSHDDADMMRADTTLLFFDYPLDYEVVEDGTYYHDPSIPIDQPYAVQPTGTKIPPQNTNGLYSSDDAKFYASQNATKNNDTKIAMGYTPFFVDLQDEFSADQNAYVDNIELLYPNTREYEDFVLSKTNLHECFIPLENRAVSMGKGEAYKNYLKSFESNTKK